MKKLLVVLVVAVLAGIAAIALGRDDAAVQLSPGPSTTPNAAATPDPQPLAVAQPVKRVILPADPVAASIEASTAGFTSAQVAIVAAEDSWTAASYAAALGIPVLLAGAEPTQQVRDELDRLGVRVVLADGVAPDAQWGSGRDVFPLAAGARAVADGLGIRLTYVGDLAGDEGVEEALTTLGTVIYDEEPASASAFKIDVGAARRSPGSVVLTDGTNLAAVGTSVGAGGRALLSGPDPRADAKMVAALGKATGVVASFAAEDPDLDWKVATAASGVQLPGGGQLVFGGKRYVALYGSPHNGALGVLGEQGVEETVARAGETAASYGALTDEKVIGALEIIVTVASGGPGGDGNYSTEWDPEGFKPLIEAAQAAGQYVVLDFQPGRSEFLSQVKAYEELLAYPNVGVALDPEWRLHAGELPLAQSGHVDIAEVNAVVSYLADFVRENALPQKLLVLHQFQVQMLRDIDQLDQSRAELAYLIHVDGQGTQEAKANTWQTLLENAPSVEHWGWKNFYDEDRPMLTPEQTYQLQPRPDFVSYQ